MHSPALSPIVLAPSASRCHRDAPRLPSRPSATAPASPPPLAPRTFTFGYSPRSHPSASASSLHRGAYRSTLPARLLSSLLAFHPMDVASADSFCAPRLLLCTHHPLRSANRFTVSPLCPLSLRLPPHSIATSAALLYPLAFSTLLSPRVPFEPSRVRLLCSASRSCASLLRLHRRRGSPLLFPPLVPRSPARSIETSRLTLHRSVTRCLSPGSIRPDASRRWTRSFYLAPSTSPSSPRGSSRTFSYSPLSPPASSSLRITTTSLFTFRSPLYCSRLPALSLPARHSGSSRFTLSLSLLDLSRSPSSSKTLPRLSPSPISLSLLLSSRSIGNVSRPSLPPLSSLALSNLAFHCETSRLLLPLFLPLFFRFHREPLLGLLLLALLRIYSMCGVY
ncbi:hypothetical protein C7M84_016555 [Penaeus vannamei]|uniref:Uncharacterized protein n=1 Tax=Penaeus vannamei TaxID=6689 RepID=A0A423SMN0_PENVA|nr:hypothetical protein C7M84_016555 [Penaeus vannamei]